MKPFTLNQGRKIASILVAFFLIVFSPLMSALAQQTSEFSIVGWTSGSTPIFSGINSNVIHLHYGDNITTAIAFSGEPSDGLLTDNDNVAFMSFSYTYSIYLTKFGQAFSTTSSILAGTHSISAFQTCNSGTVPPWTIGYDTQSTIDTNSLTMHIADNVRDCLPAGDYQVDIVLEKYSVNSVGPSPSPILLQWSGYINNSARVMSTLNAPSTDNSSDVPLHPSTSYMLSQVAFVHIAQPAICANLTLNLPHTIETFAPVVAATVVANYPGQCAQNTCSYIWSNGETTATATHLHKGNTYTVTVTAPCGNTATASITISNIMSSNVANIKASLKQEIAPMRATATPPGDRTTKKSSTHANESNTLETHLTLYPNPAIHTMTFDLTVGVNTTYSIRIYDLLGNEVMPPTIDALANAGNQKITISLDALQAGAYIYELSSDQTFRGKFVKQ